MNIFEQYFYDLSQFKRVPGNNSEHADIVNILEEKLDRFHSSMTLSGSDNIYAIPSDFYRTIQILTNKGIEVEKTTFKHSQNALISPLTAPTKSRPICYFRNNYLYILPEAIDADDSIDGRLHYYRKPNEVNWTYVVVGDVALVNPEEEAGYKDFELHPSEETELVIKILGLAGVTLKDNGLYQIASTEENKNTQQEKL
jgi:hypothetical protein